MKTTAAIRVAMRNWIGFEDRAKDDAASDLLDDFAELENENKALAANLETANALLRSAMDSLRHARNCSDPVGCGIGEAIQRICEYLSAIASADVTPDEALRQREHGRRP